MHTAALDMEVAVDIKEEVGFTHRAAADIMQAVRFALPVVMVPIIAQGIRQRGFLGARTATGLTRCPGVRR